MTRDLLSTLARFCLALLILGLAVIILLRWLRRKVLVGVMEHMASRLTRAQHTAFVLHLRDLIFKDPFRFMDMLCSKESEWFVRKMWQEVGDKVVATGMSGGAQHPSGSAVAQLEQAHAVRLSDAGMHVERVKMRDGSVLAVVTLPMPEASGETYLIGVLLPNDASLRQDLMRARKLVRYFIVNRMDGERRTDFCEWTVKGRLLTYNIGAPLDPQGFALAIQNKVDELRRRRAK